MSNPTNTERDTSIEARLRSLLNSDQPPERKYDLWSEVDKGTIVGFRFASVGYSFHNGSIPGWWYCIEHDCEHIEMHEDDIEPAE